MAQGKTSGHGIGRRNVRLAATLLAWNDEKQLGIASGPDGGFRFPNGAVRAPDASWVLTERWEKIATEQRDKFLPICCPDFAVEVRLSGEGVLPSFSLTLDVLR